MSFPPPNQQHQINELKLINRLLTDSSDRNGSQHCHGNRVKPEGKAAAQPSQHP